jgi:hypothetical protein
MFVRSTSGLCPLCFTRRELRAQHIDAIVQSESDAEALVLERLFDPPRHSASGVDSVGPGSA